MPRAHRHFISGHIWHITHRCHKQEFLLKFSKDRRRWLHWLFEARKRYGLCVLNYVVTSNHIHLLVQDTGADAISRSLQLIEGRTGQEYNNRKCRKGAYWEDRYHATAIESDEHFSRCLVYIDLNMVRAGVVRHPRDWPYGGYQEIQRPPERYRIIDISGLISILGFSSISALQKQHQAWIEQELKHGKLAREPSWSESIAVGSEPFVDQIRDSLGVRGQHRKKIEREGSFYIKEGECPYNAHLDGKMDTLKVENSYYWKVI